VKSAPLAALGGQHEDKAARQKRGMREFGEKANGFLR
jgi:hypothetical protein